MEEISFEQIARIFRIHHGLFLKVFGGALVAVSIIFLFTEVCYPINASVILQEDDASSMNLNPVTMLLGKQSQKILNEIEVIKSRTLLDGVINDLNLFFDISRRNNRMVNYLLNLLLGRPLVEGSFIIRSYPSVMTEHDSVLTTTEDGFTIKTRGTVSSCRFNETCTHAEGTLFIEKEGDISSGVSYDISYRNLVKTRQYYLENLEVTPIGDNKESNTIQVMLDSPDPHRAVRTISTLIEKYLNLKISWKKSDADEQQKYITKIINDIKTELDQKTLALATYQKENRTVLPDLQFMEIMKRDVEIEKEIAILQLKEQIVTKFVASIDLEENHPIPAPPIIDDLAVQNALQVHNTLVAQEKAMAVTMQATHPDLVKVRENILKAKEDLVNLLTKAKETYQNSAAVLRQQSGTTANIINNLPLNLRNIASLQRDVEITGKLYAFLMQKYYEAGITASMEVTPVRVLDYPTVWVKKSQPNTLVFVFFSFLCALLLAISTVLLTEFFRTRVATLAECQRILPVPASVVAAPHAADGVARLAAMHLLASKETSPLFAILFLTPEDRMLPFAEALDRQYLAREKPTSILLPDTVSASLPSINPEEIEERLRTPHAQALDSYRIIGLRLKEIPLPALFSSKQWLSGLRRIASEGRVISMLIPRESASGVSSFVFEQFSHITVVVERQHAQISDLEKLRETLPTALLPKTYLLFIS